MIKITKIILLIQVIVCILMPVVLFNVPLEFAHIANEAHGLAIQLERGNNTDVQTIAKATKVSVALRTWRNAMPVLIIVIPILGALIGLVGWQTLNNVQDNKNQTSRSTESVVTD